MQMLEILEYTALGFFPAFLLFDLVKSQRKFDASASWRLRAGVWSTAIVLMSIGLAAWYGNLFTNTLGGWSLFNGAALGTWGGALVGIFVYEIFHYTYHRLTHEWDWLWRISGHQFHHSAESLDPFGAFWLHPVDRALFITWGAIVFFPLLGVSAGAGAVAGVWLYFNSMFQHVNVRTPKWLGYFLQRPEMHILHHGRGVHRHNYTSLSLIDIIMGTFRNPSADEVEGKKCGFFRGSSEQFVKMMTFQDASEPPAGSEIASSASVRRAA